MANPLLPVALVNALAAIPGGSGNIELRSTLAFLEEEHATEFVQHLVTIGALQTYGIAAASQAEAEAGSSTALRAWTPQRVAQAIAALAPAPDLSGYASISYVTGAIATAVASTYQPKGGINCSGNPNYPAATVNDTYVVTTAGKIGGGSGIEVEAGDTLVCVATAASGNHATVGASWVVGQGNITGITGLGLALMRAPNPSAVRFIRINADNTVSLLSDVDMKTALGISGAVTAPKVYHVATNGNDTTGDGTPSSPFLTAGKAYAVGNTGGSSYCIKLGVGSFELDCSGENVNSLLRSIEGMGMSYTASEALTHLDIILTGASSDTGPGEAGGEMRIELWNLNAMIYGDGGSSTQNDESSGFGANGSTIVLRGHAFIGIQANGGDSTFSSGGVGGYVTCNGMHVSDENISLRAGAGALEGSAAGTMIAWKCDFSNWGANNSLGANGEFVTLGGCFVNPAAQGGGFYQDQGGNSSPPA